jgi:hypothetical protein
MSKRHKVVTIGHCAHNFFPQGSEKVRGFAEMPNFSEAAGEPAPSRSLEHWLDQGWRILSAQSTGGALEHGFYGVTTYVLESPDGWKA